MYGLVLVNAGQNFYRPSSNNIWHYYCNLAFITKINLGMKAFYILLFTALLSISCNSVKRTQKFVAQGNYNQAIELAVKKLQKDKDAKEYDAHIRLLEEAFLKAKDEDSRHIAFLKKENSPRGAKEIYYTYLDLRARQDLIRPLLPLYSNEMGRKANFVFTDYTFWPQKRHTFKLCIRKPLFICSTIPKKTTEALSMFCVNWMKCNQIIATCISLGRMPTFAEQILFSLL